MIIWNAIFIFLIILSLIRGGMMLKKLEYLILEHITEFTMKGGTVTLKFVNNGCGWFGVR